MKDAEDREREIEIKGEEDPDTEELIEEKIPEEANQKDEGSISGLPNIGDKEFSPQGEVEKLMPEIEIEKTLDPHVREKEPEMVEETSETNGGDMRDQFGGASAFENSTIEEPIETEWSSDQGDMAGVLNETTLLDSEPNESE